MCHTAWSGPSVRFCERYRAVLSLREAKRRDNLGRSAQGARNCFASLALKGLMMCYYGNTFPGFMIPIGSSAALIRCITASSAPPRQSGIM